MLKHARLVRFTGRKLILCFGDQDLHYVYLKERDFDTVYETFVKASSDYQIKIEITREQLRARALSHITFLLSQKEIT
jgi:hypothetical protein